MYREASEILLRALLSTTYFYGTDGKMSLDKQYTTDIIQWQDISTQKSLSTAYKMRNGVEGGYLYGY